MHTGYTTTHAVLRKFPMYIYIATIQCMYMYLKFKHMCEQTCKNRPCEYKFYQVIFLLISSIQNVVYLFCKLQRKAHKIMQ